MGLTKPVNENYCASIVRLRSIIKLENCDNLVHTNIFGNMVIVSKDTDDNAVGIYFPPECQLSPEFLSNNNLYRHSELNVDEETKGYFEDNGRVRTIKLRGNKSMGLFMPLSSLSFTEHTENLKVGDEFDQINGIPICKKYVVRRMQGMGGKGKKDRKPKVSKLMDNQFRFHYDTSQLGKNIHVIHPDDLISLTLKLHGTSVVISKLLCKKKLNIFHRFLRWLKVPIIDTHYENIYSSR